MADDLRALEAEMLDADGEAATLRADPPEDLPGPEQDDPGLETSSMRIRAVRSGHIAYGGGRLLDRLAALRRQGAVELPDDEALVFQRIANVETAGNLQAVNTWDTGVVSVGFMQWTVRWDEAQDLISRAPSAFARHDIVLGGEYTFTSRRRSWTVRGIQGVADRDDLRSEEWTRRFFMAALEPEALVATVEKARAQLARLSRRVRKWSGEQWDARFDDPVPRALLAELYNNRPAYVRSVVTRVTAQAAKNRIFELQPLLIIAIDQVYLKRENNQAKARRLIDKICAPVDASVLG